MVIKHFIVFIVLLKNDKIKLGKDLFFALHFPLFVFMKDTPRNEHYTTLNYTTLHYTTLLPDGGEVSNMEREP